MAFGRIYRTVYYIEYLDTFIGRAGRNTSINSASIIFIRETHFVLRADGDYLLYDVNNVINVIKRLRNNMDNAFLRHNMLFESRNLGHGR